MLPVGGQGLPRTLAGSWTPGQYPTQTPTPQAPSSPTPSTGTHPQATRRAAKANRVAARPDPAVSPCPVSHPPVYMLHMLTDQVHRGGRGATRRGDGGKFRHRWTQIDTEGRTRTTPSRLYPCSSVFICGDLCLSAFLRVTPRAPRLPSLPHRHPPAARTPGTPLQPTRASRIRTLRASHTALAAADATRAPRQTRGAATKHSTRRTGSLQSTHARVEAGAAADRCSRKSNAPHGGFAGSPSRRVPPRTGRLRRYPSRRPHRSVCPQTTRHATAIQMPSPRLSREVPGRIEPARGASRTTAPRQTRRSRVPDQYPRQPSSPEDRRHSSHPSRPRSGRTSPEAHR